MIENEYLTVKEISIRTLQSTRNVRRRIKKLECEVGKELLHQDKNHNWRVHHILLSRFKPQRVRANKYYALSIDPCYYYSEAEIDAVMAFIIEQMGESGIELNYVVERKKANDQNHIHCYIKCSNKKKLLQCVRLGFSKLSYHHSAIYDLGSWKQYITKDNNNIKTLKS